MGTWLLLTNLIFAESKARALWNLILCVLARQKAARKRAPDRGAKPMSTLEERHKLALDL